LNGRRYGGSEPITNRSFVEHLQSWRVCDSADHRKGDGGVAAPPSVGTHEEGEPKMSANNVICSSWLKWWRKLFEIMVLLLNHFCSK